MPWFARHLRLTVFFDPATPFPALPTWEQIAGGPPETEIKQGIVTQAQGPFGRGGLTLGTIAPARADVIYQAPEAQIATDFGFDTLTLGPAADAVEAFAPIAKRFLAADAIVTRLAFGTQVAWPTAGRDESYHEIVGRIRTVDLNLEGARDFSYQINRPRRSNTVEGAVLNRVARWVSMRGALMIPTPVPGQPALAAESHAVMLELDINSDPMRAGPIAHSSLPPLFDELAHLADEIMEDGDIP